MRPLRLAIIGFGKLGQACFRAALDDEQLRVAGFVRRVESLAEPLRLPFDQGLAVSHISELGDVDIALICVPTVHVLGATYELLQRRIPIVECATLHQEAFVAHKQEIERIATLHKVAAVVGAGWDPGALSLFRDLFALLSPKGHTETSRRPGVSLHHSTVAGTVPGVKNALSTELRTAEGKVQHYVYVQLADPSTLPRVAQAIRQDPLFLGEETQVFAVDDVATLEEEGHGVVMERRGMTAEAERRLFLLEARFSELMLAAQVMLMAARAIPYLKRRAYSLFDLPIGALWGNLQAWAEQEWI
jgi:diaminopimelate dehydrogenase